MGGRGPLGPIEEDMVRREKGGGSAHLQPERSEKWTTCLPHPTLSV